MTNPAEPSSSSTAPAADGRSPAPAPRPRPTASTLVVVAAIGMMVGALGVVLLRSSSPPAPAPARASAARPRSDATAATATATNVARPKWSGGVRRSNGRNVAVYELLAENDIAVWNKVVRPILTVRCMEGTTEVFVYTQSAAAIDGDDGKHTVQVGYDEQPDASERWLASDEYDALFAENGVGAARKIANSRTMRFAFTPYNASPVIARFQVAGFDALAPKLARACRW